MKDLSEKIMAISIPLGVAILVIYFISSVIKEFSNLKLAFYKFFMFLKRKIFFLSSLRRFSFYKELQKKEFIEFQKNVLCAIYSTLVNEYNKSSKDVHINLTKMFNYQYDNIDFTFPNNNIDYPFNKVLDKKSLNYDNVNRKFNKRRLTRNQKKLYSFIKQTIHYPNNIGYMLKGYDFEDKSTKIEAKTSIYMDNIMDSHYLGYELYLFYKQCKNINGKYYINKKEVKFTKDFLLSYLPERNKIHQQYIKNEHKEANVLINGNYRNSLLGVQALVLVKNYSGKYDVLRIRRSNDVVDKANFLQFIPSGGFECIEYNNSFENIYDSFSLSKVMFKELLEEVFGHKELTRHKDFQGENSYYIEPIRILLNDLKNHKAKFSLLGTSMNLAGLRHELSFLLVIDNEELRKNIVSNSEAKGNISFINYEVLKDESYWHRYSNKKTNIDLDYLNPSSAGLFNLAKNYLDKNPLK